MKSTNLTKFAKSILNSGGEFWRSTLTHSFQIDQNCQTSKFLFAINAANKPSALRILPPGTLSRRRRRIDPWNDLSTAELLESSITSREFHGMTDGTNALWKISRPRQEPIKNRTTLEIRVTFAETVVLIVLVFSSPGVWCPLVSCAIFTVPLFPSAIEILSSLSQKLSSISHYSSVLRVSVIAFWIPKVSLFTSQSKFILNLIGYADFLHSFESQNLRVITWKLQNLQSKFSDHLWIHAFEMVEIIVHCVFDFALSLGIVHSNHFPISSCFWTCFLPYHICYVHYWNIQYI